VTGTTSRGKKVTQKSPNRRKTTLTKPRKGETFLGEGIKKPYVLWHGKISLVGQWKKRTTGSIKPTYKKTDRYMSKKGDGF